MRHFLIVLGLMFCACEELDFPDPDDIGASEADMSVPDSSSSAGENEGQGRGGGSLPPGFFERGCQWDRPCGGPMPGQRLSPADRE